MMALPKIGLEAVLVVREFQKNQKKYERGLKDITGQTKKAADSVTKSGQQMARSWEELNKQSKVLSDAFRELLPEDFAKRLAPAYEEFEKLGRSAKVNVERFDELANAGLKLGDAMKIAGSGAAFSKEKFIQAYDATTDYDLALKAGLGTAGKVMTTTAALSVAMSAFSLVIGATTKVIKEAIDSYTELAKEVRIIRLELGSTASEASAWVAAAKLSGASASTLATTLAQLDKRLIDTKLRQIEGKEASTAFTRAMDALGVSATNADGSLKSSSEILQEVRTELQELGPGAVTTGLAMDIFGRSVKNILPFLLESTATIEELEKESRRLGATITTQDLKAYQDWQVATAQLHEAKQGLLNYLARFWLPILTKGAEAVRELINWYRRLIIIWASVTVAAGKLVTSFGNIGEFANTYRETWEKLSGTMSDLEKREEELAIARNKAAQDAALAARAEEELAERRQEVLDQLADLQQQYSEKILDIERQFDRRWEDLLERRARSQIERAMQLGWRLEDLWKSHQDKLADITRSYESRLSDIDADRAKRLAKVVEDGQRRREDLEAKHQERLYKIRTKFQDAVEEAVRKNDAVAYLRALRTRNRELRDAEHARQLEQRDLAKDLKQKRAEIEDDYRERKAEEERRYNEQIERANEQYAKQLEAQRIQNERERELRALKERWELDDFNKAKRRALQDAERWYRREEAELQAHLATMTQTATQGITQLGNSVAQATGAAARQIADAAASAIESVGRGTLYTQPTARSTGSVGGGTLYTRPTYTQPLSSLDLDNIIRRGTPGGFRAAGGVDVVNRPTTVTMGEAGSEMHAFIPLRGAMNVSHQFGRLPVDINGAQGVDENQVNNIVYSAMTDLARRLAAYQVRR